MVKVTTSFRLEPETKRNIKMLAAQHDCYPNDIIEVALELLISRPAAEVAALVAKRDESAGVMLPKGMPESSAISLARHEHRKLTEDIEKS